MIKSLLNKDMNNLNKNDDKTMKPSIAEGKSDIDQQNTSFQYDLTNKEINCSTEQNTEPLILETQDEHSGNEESIINLTKDSYSKIIDEDYRPAPGQISSITDDQVKHEAPSKPAYLNSEDTATSLIWRICKAKTQKLFKKINNLATNRTLHIGISARIFHPEPGAKGLRGKTLQYLEECIAHWVMSRDVIVFMIPTVAQKGSIHSSSISLRDYAKHLDGLVLQGGADVSPLSYGEKATKPEWAGDQVRDMYELDLCRNFIELDKPVLGICRGCQLINVAFGGSLYQDIATEHGNPAKHVAESYDLHHHEIELNKDSSLAKLFDKSKDNKQWIVNSIHHQAVKDLGKDIKQEAFSKEDGITEAIRHTKSPFVVGIQWHPEFHQPGIDNLLDCTPLLDQFLRAARETRF